MIIRAAEWPTDTSTQDLSREAFIVSSIRAGQTAAQVARTLGVSRERVRQIFTRGTGARIPRFGSWCRICRDRYVNLVSHRRGAAHRRALDAKTTARQVRHFWAKVQRGVRADECWAWLGSTYPAGYGHSAARRLEPSGYAHRVAYTLLVGPIPSGLTIDHLCRNRGCVNPVHLEPVTHRENTLRSPDAPAAINARKTHCPKGHPYSGRNLVITKSGRNCRLCANARSLARYYRRKALAA